MSILQPSTLKTINFEIPFLEKVLTMASLNDEQKAGVIAYVSKGEGYFIPYGQIIYLGNLSVLHAAEEAGHYLRYILSGIDKPKTPEDTFYISILNEAFAYLASKFVIPSRAPIELDAFEVAVKSDLSDEQRQNLMIHAMGYELGEKLYRKFRRKSRERAILKEIFSRRFTRKGEAKEFYYELCGKNLQ